MTNPHDRRAELIAGAVADDLDAAEDAELRALAAADPSVHSEMQSMRETVSRLSPASGVRWEDAEPGDLLRRRVVAATSHRSRWATVGAVAAGIAIGVASVGAIQTVRGPDTAVVAAEAPGPPGELGAFETVDFSEFLSGVSVDGGLIAHTWGTETVLDMSGVPVDRDYEVFLIERSGDVSASGSFRGSAVDIDCRMNASVLRGDVVGIEIRSGAQVLAQAAVPTVG